MAIEPRVKVVSGEVKAAIRRVLQALPLGGDGRPLFTMIGRHVKTDVQLNFRKQMSPQGVPWIPSQRVIEHGGQTLRLTGRLRNSITYLAGHEEVEVGTNVVYARRQQEGYSGGTGRGHSKTPARPFLGLSEQGSKGLVEAVNGFLGKRWAS